MRWIGKLPPFPGKCWGLADAKDFHYANGKLMLACQWVADAQNKYVTLQSRVAFRMTECIGRLSA